MVAFTSSCLILWNGDNGTAVGINDLDSCGSSTCAAGGAFHHNPGLVYEPKSQNEMVTLYYITPSAKMGRIQSELSF